MIQLNPVKELGVNLKENTKTHSSPVDWVMDFWQ